MDIFGVNDYADAGSLNSLLSVTALVDDSTFLTKALDVGVVYRIAGVDPEGCDQQARKGIVHRFEAAIRPLDERFHLTEYIVKTRVPPFTAPACVDTVAGDAIQRRVDGLNRRRSTLYDIDLYFVILLTGPSPRTGAWLSETSIATLIEADLWATVKRLHHAAGAFEVALTDTIRPARLQKQEVFSFLRRLVNYAPHKRLAPLTHDTHLDYFVADSPVDCGTDRLVVDSHYTVKMLAMKAPPARTFPDVLGQIQAIPSECIVCLSWHRIAVDVMRKDLTARKKHFHSSRKTVTPATASAAPVHAADELIDDSADAKKAQIGAALLEMEVEGRAFGECALTLAIYDRDATIVDESVAQAVKIFAAHDGAVVEETYNVLNAWVAMMPGNYAHQVRHLALMDINLADMSFLFTMDCGDTRNAHLEAPSLIDFETTADTVYHHNVHHEDNGHTLTIGAPGGGKSFLQACAATHAQQYDPFTVILDQGHSYRRIAEALGGSYLELGLRAQGVHLNPFALPFTPENVHFFHQFVQLLLESRGSDPLTEREDRELYESILALEAYEPAHRRLFSLTLPGPLQKRLEKWTAGGRYPLFDHEDDTLRFQRFQVFEFEEMSKYPDLLEPLLFYVLHRVSQELGRGFTLCILDEAWRFIRHPVLCDYVREALKTWRKKNAAMWLATQTLKDFDSADLLRTVVESCPTKFLLWNPAFDRGEYATTLQLNDVELDLVAGLAPKREMFLKRPDVSKVLRLNVDPQSAWLYSHDPVADRRLVKSA